MITKYVKGQTGRTAYREARGHDAQAPVAKFGENVMHITSKDPSKSGQNVDAKFHERIRLGLRMKSDESIIGTPSGVIRAKTARRVPEDQRWCAAEVLNIRRIPSNPVRGAGGDHILIEAYGTKHSERGEDEHAPALEREKCGTRSAVAAPDPTVRECTQPDRTSENTARQRDAQDAGD